MREILATRGSVVELHIGSDCTKLSLAEAEAVVTQLLGVLPFPETVRMLWAARTTPHAYVVHYYKHHEGEISSAGYKLIVKLGDKVLHVGPMRTEQDEAVSSGLTSYGAPVPVDTHVTQDPVSYAAAEKESLWWQLRALAAAEGMSVNDFIKANR